MTPALSVRGLSKSYGRLRAVHDVDFDVAAGEAVGLLGVNGAGKTTTLEMLVGLVEPDRGSIGIGSIDARASPAAAKAAIGTALQATSLPARMTPLEALRLFGACYPRRIAPATLLDRFGLTDKAGSAFATLSGGQQQRLALALALVNDPRVVILDEPTAGLDPASRRDLHDDIDAMKRDGCAILLATHDMAEAERLCDRVCLIDGGRIVAEGVPAALIAAADGGEQVVVETSVPLTSANLAALAWEREVAIEDTLVRFPARDLNDRLAALIAVLDAAHVAITDIRVGRRTLEDVVLALARAGAMQ